MDEKNESSSLVESLASDQLNAIRAVIERNHAHFVNRYLMHPGCMWPDDLMKEIADALCLPTAHRIANERP
ncbi:hypothetical protein [Xanthomonas campestris]|jgi:hypothetical protein|uniref:hypothetical protein n=1 Tax=Xanthomonas campestris TaxID=339 RepID=UPI002B221D98|nr:hypothetical protein [Xanthomonas campestris]MEA9732554.1 hypothetical protein [Xanthomonas campestris]